jgi:hypothetical protein
MRREELAQYRSRFISAPIAFDEVGDPFSHHDDGSVQIARWDEGHGRGIDDPQALETPHPELRVDDGTTAI